jgi:hypothetical protein
MEWGGKSGVKKEEKGMKRRFWETAVVLMCLAIGFAASAGAQTGNRGGPVISRSFASRAISPGSTWKVYINASAPGGGMTSIYATVLQPGMGQYPVSITKLKEENQKEFSGFIYLSTFSPQGSLDGISLILTVQIKDHTDTFSEPAVFPLEIQSRASPEAPPPGVFREQGLGPIMVTLRPVLPHRG